MLIKDAKNIMFGSQQVEKVYAGSTVVWEANKIILPEGYTEVSGITRGSSGVPRVTTGLRATFDISVKMTVNIKNANTSDYICGGYNSNGGWYVGIRNDNELTIRRYIKTSSSLLTAITVPKDRKFTFFVDLINGKCIIDGNEYDFTKQTGTVSSTMYFCLGAVPYNSSTSIVQNTVYGSGNVIMGKTQIFKGGELYYDYIPCYGETERKRGMYDLVQNKFVSSVDTTTHFMEATL